MTGTLCWCLASVVFITSSLATDTCPESCSCHGNKLKCSPDTNGGVKLRKVPPDLLRFYLYHIKDVNLSWNDIQQIEPGDFYGLPKAVSLDLRHNRLRALLRNGFTGLDGLVTLDLSYNIIRYIDRFAFEGLRSIQKIDLSHNEIAFIEDDSFITSNGLGVLLKLDLSFNKINHLNGGTFIGLRSVEELYLNNNAIQRIHTGVFTPLSSLERLYIGENSINCSCDWLEVWDNLQSRDVEIMDTSDPFISCSDTAETCYAEDQPAETSEDGTGTADVPRLHTVGRLATNLTTDDLRPPETDGQGNVVAADGNSFPLWSPEGERVLSAHDTATRRRIEEVEDADRRRMFTAVFQDRMRGFMRRMKPYGQQQLTSTLGAMSTESTDSEENEDELQMNDSDEYDDEYDKDDVTSPPPPSNASRSTEPDAVMAALIKDVLRLVLPPSRQLNASVVPESALGSMWIPNQVRLINRIVGDNRAEIGRAEANVSTPGPSAAPTNTSSTLHPTSRPATPSKNQTRPKIEIPFFAVVGIFIFVCIAAGAIGMFSGACRNRKGSDCCDYSWKSAISEKLALRKLQMQRQSRKTTAAKSDFLKMHCVAKQVTDASVSETSPNAMPTQLVADDRGVVTVTPLVLTDEFPEKPGTTPLQSNPRTRKTSSRLLNYIKNRLSSDKDAATRQPPSSTSPRDEITLFKIPVNRSTSEPVTKTHETNNFEDDWLPVPSTDVCADDSDKRPANQTAVAKSLPNDAFVLAQNITDENIFDDKPATSNSDATLDVTRTSSDLRWYATECLSNQRMMTQGRTLSMASSNDVIDDLKVKKGDAENDGVW